MGTRTPLRVEFSIHTVTLKSVVDLNNYELDIRVFVLFLKPDFCILWFLNKNDERIKNA